ncbi:hypothetical protein [Actinoplanes teichomyceticus]|uniref:RHIM domain-containing protein n=1 Tax=Actinoplanes teichomyceticus TaxID=1867 RepID=A0A561VL77_ACTTI|nr:hypothetical protein [Actinoplanes teichomyceticus]TWG12344.1 hypothetical protein FHX34_105211 [Actinoplanes teichomyceticus]GIF14284.1 hypothetical protein Ate01nite_43160 [Actinoplanes teichomyceticus]
MLEVIVAALAAGASAGVSGTATEAVSDSYQLLKTMIRQRFGGRPQARQALEADETEPGTWAARIGDDLTDSGAADDQRIVAVARELLELAGPQGRTFRVDLSRGRGVQIGDHNIQTNTFH